MSIERYINYARDYKKKNLNASIFDFLEIYPCTRQFKDDPNYNHLINQLCKIFNCDDPDTIKLMDEIWR